MHSVCCWTLTLAEHSKHRAAKITSASSHCLISPDHGVDVADVDDVQCVNARAELTHPNSPTPASGDDNGDDLDHCTSFLHVLTACRMQQHRQGRPCHQPCVHRARRRPPAHWSAPPPAAQHNATKRTRTSSPPQSAMHLPTSSHVTKMPWTNDEELRIPQLSDHRRPSPTPHPHPQHTSTSTCARLGKTPAVE